MTAADCASLATTLGYKYSTRHKGQGRDETFRFGKWCRALTECPGYDGSGRIAHTIDKLKRYVYLRNVPMEIPRPTAKGFFIVAFGIAMSLIGVYMARVSWTRTTGIGLALVGFGLGSLGVTNGFSDQSPLGKLLFKLGLIAFCIGIPLGVYAFYNGAF